MRRREQSVDVFIKCGFDVLKRREVRGFFPHDYERDTNKIEHVDQSWLGVRDFQNMQAAEDWESRFKEYESSFVVWRNRKVKSLKDCRPLPEPLPNPDEDENAEPEKPVQLNPKSAPRSDVIEEKIIEGRLPMGIGVCPGCGKSVNVHCVLRWPQVPGMRLEVTCSEECEQQDKASLEAWDHLIKDVATWIVFNEHGLIPIAGKKTFTIRTVVVGSDRSRETKNEERKETQHGSHP
jgi:hypothetical protein